MTIKRKNKACFIIFPTYNNYNFLMIFFFYIYCKLLFSSVQIINIKELKINIIIKKKKIKKLIIKEDLV